MFKKAILAGLLMVPLASGACPPTPTQHPGAQSEAGAAFGTLFGSRLGAGVDPLDRQMAEQMLYTVLEKFPTGETGQWINPDTGSNGFVTVTRTRLVETPGHIALCRDFTATIVIADKQHEVSGTARRQSDGSWEVTERDAPGDLLPAD